MAAALNFDFEGPVHGAVVDQFVVGGLIMDIAAENFSAVDLAVIFDSTIPGSPDLTFDDQGNVLILQENRRGCNDGVCNRPDDEAANPAGTFTLDFSMGLREFGTDLLDIDLGEVALGSFQFFVRDNGGFAAVGPTVSFDDLTDIGSMFYDPSIQFGNNTANTVMPFLASDFGANAFDRVVVTMGGSGAIDNVHAQAVPEPATVALVSVGFLALALARRRYA